MSQRFIIEIQIPCSSDAEAWGLLAAVQRLVPVMGHQLIDSRLKKSQKAGWEFVEYPKTAEELRSKLEKLRADEIRKLRSEIAVRRRDLELTERRLGELEGDAEKLPF